MSDASAPQGEIYDLGYRNYDGERLGRRYALRSLIVLSVRNVFGLGRGALPKVLAFTLTAMAYIVAIVRLIGAALGADLELVGYDGHFDFIQIFLVLFVATMASDLVSNDRKNNLLSLYFSRPIARDDYALAKIAALSIALLALTLGPQLLLFAANWLGASDSTDWISDNVDLLPRILFGSFLAAAQLGALGVAIAMLAKRRAFALISVLGTLLVLVIASQMVANLLDPTTAAVAILVSPLMVLNAGQRFAYGTIPPASEGAQESSFGELLAYTDMPHWLWLAAALVHTAIAVAVAVRYYRRAM